MQMSMAKRAASILLVLCATTTHDAAAQRGMLDSSRSAAVRDLVARQAASELAVRFGGRALPNAGGISLERAEGIGEGLPVWRALLPSDHSHPYLLVVSSGAVLRLGGFEAPELRLVSELMDIGPAGEATARRRANALALLADANGAVQFVFTGLPDAPGYVPKVAATWRRQAPHDWPPDTIFARPEGGRHVSLTLLSRATRSYTLHWVPTAYSFEFDEHGRLAGWARRTGEFFGVKGVPLSPTRLDR